VVDKSLEAHWMREGLQPTITVREKIAVAISSNPIAQYLIARGGRMAHGIDADFYVVYVDSPDDQDGENRRTLQENIRFAENLGATVVRLPRGSIADRVAEFVREKHITHVIFGRSAQEGWRKYLYLTVIQRFLRQAPPIDVHIVTQEAK
jgi:two-component system sensor histidine kinase KdpD